MKNDLNIILNEFLKNWRMRILGAVSFLAGKLKILKTSKLSME